MNIYYVWQEENNNWDTYDSFVCVASSDEVARNLDPATGEPMTKEDWEWGSWAPSVKYVQVQWIGIAHPTERKTRIVCSSFNTG